MQLLQAGLDRASIRTDTRDVQLRDLPSVRCAFLTNSVSPVRPIASIDDVAFAIDAELMRALTACYESNPWEPV